MKAGQAAAQRGDAAEAARQFERAYRSFEASLGERHPDTLAAMSGLAQAYGALDKHEAQLALNLKVLNLRTEVLGERHPDTLASLNNVGSSYWALGRYPEQLQAYERLLALRTEVLGRQHPDSLAAMSNLALAYRIVGRHAEAIALNEQALELRTKLLGERHPDTLSSIGQLALAYRAVGRDAEALALNEKALKLRTEVLGEQHADTLTSMNSLAINYTALGRFDDAQAIFERVVEMRARVSGERHWATFVAMNNLAGAYWGQGLHAEALALNKRVLDLRMETLGERHPDTLVSMRNVALSHSALGRHADALALQERALALNTQALGERHPSTINNIVGIADTYSALGRQTEALALYEKALQLRGEVLGMSHPETLKSIDDLALAYGASGRPRDALALSARYVSGAEQQRGQPGLSADNRRSIFQSYAQGYRRFSIYSGRVNDVAQGFRLAELSRARTLLESMTAQRAGRLGALPAAEQASLEDLNRQIGAYGQLIAQVRSAEARLNLEAARNDLVRQYEVLNTRLKTEYPKYAQLSEPHLVDTKDLRGFVAANAVAVNYVVVGDGAVAAWLVDSSGTPRFVDLGQLPNLADAVETLRLASAHMDGLQALPGEEGRRAWRLADGSYRLLNLNIAAPEGAVAVGSEVEVASYLSDRLLKPLEGSLRGKAQWIICPDGPLAQLPFELLSFDGRRVLEAVELHYAQSLSVYALARERQREYRVLQRPRDVLAMGNPEYETGREPASERKARLRRQPIVSEDQLRETRFAWDPLPGSEIEIKAIRRVLPNTDAYLQSRASEAQLQRLNQSGDLKHYRILHFAVHANLSTQDPALSSLVLSQKNLEPGTDGYITAAKWPAYELRSDLTVMSACETGLGKSLAGEGVMGLPFALFLAGNVNTMLTLWPVIDSVAPVFMQKFYARIKAGKSAARALTETKREMAADPRFRHPVYWAPFILVGAG